MSTIAFVRHGDTDWNMQGRVQGHAPVSLNDKGRKKMEVLRPLIRRLRPDAVYSSPIARAVESAEILAKPLALQVTCLPDLTELDVGEWFGKTVEELESTSESWRQFHVNPLSSFPPKGEDISSLHNRVVEVLDLILNRSHSSAVIVTHAEVIRVAICHCIKLPLEHLLSLKVDLGSVSVVNWTDKRSELTALNHPAFSGID